MGNEAERIRRVYAAYDAARDIQDRWAAENLGNRVILEERARETTAILETAGLLPLSEKRVLDVGCGRGHVLASLTRLGASPRNLCGIDLLADRIEQARSAYPEIQFICANAECLDWPDAVFDLVLLHTVFSSIRDDGAAERVAAEVVRVLRPGGRILWYDLRYSNPWNPRVRAISKRRIAHLFPGFDLELRALTLLPLLARRLGRATPALYPLLAALPMFRTHYFGLLMKPP